MEKNVKYLDYLTERCYDIIRFNKKYYMSKKRYIYRKLVNKDFFKNKLAISRRRIE